MLNDFLTTVSPIVGDNDIGQPIADGSIHRFHFHGDKQGKNNGWYVLHEGRDGFIAGTFGCWKRGISEKWNNRGNKLTSADKKQLSVIQKKIENALQEKRLEAKGKAISIKSKALKQSNPYLIAKGFQQSGLVYKDCLVIPIYNAQQELCSLQFIDPDGEKRFLSGGQVQNCYYTIGKSDSKIYICEGYATGLTINQSIECGVVVAFNAGNLLPVAEAIQAKYPEKEIVICADNDQWTAGNPGVAKATEAAQAIGAKLVIPKFKSTDTKPTDFNDLMQLEGLNEVSRQMKESTPTELPATPMDLSKISLFDEAGEKPKNKSQATLLIDIAGQIQLFHDGKNKAYGIIYTEKSKRIIYPIRSDDFKNWLSHCYFGLTGKGCNSASINDALNTIEAKAKFKSQMHEVYTRIARIKDIIYIDLCDDCRQVVEITGSGWQLLKESPVMFVRNNHMKALPTPLAGEKLDCFWDCVNLKDRDKTLVLGWLLCALRGSPPYPILNIQGEQGSGKSFLCHLLRDLIDPSISSNRNMPSDDKELLAAIVNNAVISLDNISKIDGKTSDSLCRVATGGALSFRELYTDTDEVLYEVSRPVILNGITDIVTRPDLLDRCISIYLEPISEATRKTEQEIDSRYQKHKGDITGSLYDLISGALKYESEIKLPKMPRLADAVIWITAAEKSSTILQEGSFIKIYEENINTTIEESIEASPVANGILLLMSQTQEWIGTATALLDKLDLVVDERAARSKFWPQSPRSLTNVIKRYKPQFRRLGIEIDDSRSHGKNLINIKNIGNLNTPHTPDSNNANNHNVLKGVLSNSLGVSGVHKETNVSTPADPFIDKGYTDVGVQGVHSNQKLLEENLEVIEL